jgi:Fe-S oxidoreductase
MAAFKVPTLGPRLEIPPVTPKASAHVRPYVAKPNVQSKLGFPGELVPDWERKAVVRLGELVRDSRALRVFLDSCVECGACTEKCHYYLGTGDPNNMPVARQNLLRSVYRRYYTLPGKVAPWLVGARDMTKDVLDEWYTYFHQCSQCRRCAVSCPFGIDTAEISMAAREVMDSVGLGQKYTNEVIGKVHRIGNNLGLPGPALRDTLEGLEEDVREETGLDVKFPLDQKGAEVMLVTPSADFFAEPHVDGLIGYAKVFHAAGISWTVSTHASEMSNFALFIGARQHMKQVAERIREAALDLGVRRIVVGECGHAWRVAYNYWNTLIGPFDFLDPNYPRPQHICELTYDLLQRGAIRLDKPANDDKVVTYHDSCNIARASRLGNMAGGQFILPRAIIQASVNRYYEMAKGTTEEKTFCCGAGAGLLTDELMEIRVKGAYPRMQALKRVIDDHGVNYMAAMCAICKSQFTQVLPYYELPRDFIGSIHGLVSRAIRLGAVNE